MKYWVGVTHNAWFEYLRSEGPDEVNFWQPGGKAPFVNLPTGSPFLFKLKRPFNHIAGGGYFVKYSSLPLSLMWETFLTKNGAASRVKLEAMIRPLLRDPAEPDPTIGCLVLAQPFFWPESEWIPAPMDWAGSIQRGRYYDTTHEEGARIWALILERQIQSDVVAEQEARYGDWTLFRPRLGQGAFRLLVTDAYQRRCAITGERTLPVLEAAHVLPYAEGGPNELTNGLLLRSDFHRLFDAGLVTVTPNLHVEVSSRIREEWFNGAAYYRLHGKALASLPVAAGERPYPEYLQWHNDSRFRG